MIHLVKEVLFPPSCLICKGKLRYASSYICLHCELDLPLALREKGVQPIERSLWGRMQLGWGVAMYAFASGALTQELLHQLKYGGNAEAVQHFGTLLGKELMRFTETDLPDVIVPIPLHPKKLKIRGYNQAGELAKGVKSVLGIEMDVQLLERSQHHSSLTKLGRNDRWQQISSSYILAPEPKQYRHVLLIDDVVTTGATIEACATVLHNQGVERISVAALAYADKLL